MMARLKFVYLPGVIGFAILTVISGALLPVAADENDHDRARAALEAGNIVSLDRVLSKVENMFNGSILEVELEEEEREFLGGDGERPGEHVGKEKDAFPGIGPVDSTSDNPAEKSEPLSDSSGGYVDGEGAVAGKYTRGGTIFIYKVKLLSPQGNVLRIEFNAKSMKILGVSGRDSESARKRR